MAARLRDGRNRKTALRRRRHARLRAWRSIRRCALCGRDVEGRQARRRATTTSRRGSESCRAPARARRGLRRARTGSECTRTGALGRSKASAARDAQKVDCTGFALNGLSWNTDASRAVAVLGADPSDGVCRRSRERFPETIRARRARPLFLFAPFIDRTRRFDPPRRLFKAVANAAALARARSRSVGHRVVAAARQTAQYHTRDVDGRR